MNNISICLCSDNNYIQHLGATISSIIKNKNKDEFINIYIIDGGIDNENKNKLSSFENNHTCKINYITPNIEKLSNCHIFSGDYISIATYYRLLIPELITTEDRIIYLDCDIIVLDSLRELYNKDFNNNLILGVEDVASMSHIKRLNIKKYINAGVLLINLKQMKEENSTKIIFDWIKNNQEKIECHDQDIINASLNNRLEYIEEKYNVQVKRKNSSKFEKIKKPTILHFISPKKPWTLYKPYNYTNWEKEYFYALENTPWESFINHYKNKKTLYLALNLFYPTGIVKDLIRNIFSIKNSNDKKYKIITILSIKFKFLRKKVINDDLKIKIIVGYHKKNKIFNSQFLIPIQLGKEIANQNSKDGKISKADIDWLDKNMIGDNTGDNISSKNRYYNEMTGIYWAYKNYEKIGNPDYIGLNHYRRYFKLNYTNLKNTLSKYDLIYLKKPAFNEGIYNQWKNSSLYSDFDNDGIDKLIEIYKNIHQEDYDNFIEFLHKPNQGGFMNLFIMEKDDFINYCEWIFKILNSLENTVNKNNRTIGMLSERLTSYYLYKLTKDGRKILKTSITDEPPRLEIKYLISQIFNIKNFNQTSGKKYIQITFFGIKAKIQAKGK